jgi:hypothetical protein
MARWLTNFLLGRDLKASGVDSVLHEMINKDPSLFLTSRLLELRLNDIPVQSLHDVEFSVYSQFGDDGIIHFLLSKMKPVHKKFIEFGVENYSESNTRYLLESKNWSGLIIDGDTAAMKSIRSQEVYWRHDLTAVGAFISRENINELLREAGFEGDIGLLSIDLDGVDYWVWEAIDCINPSLVVAEYNSIFGPTHAISVPYRPDFDRREAHWSCLFWGASIAALDHLATARGYSLVGCNSAGNNAYFVRNDCLARIELPRLNPNNAFVDAKFRESRDKSGNLSFLRGVARLGAIAGLRVVDVKSGSTHVLGDLLLN